MTLEAYRRRDGTIVWYCKFFRQHRRYWKNLGPIPKAEALKREKRFKAEVEAGIYQPKPRRAPPPSPTVEALAHRFIDSYAPGHRPRSTARHLSRLTWHLLPRLVDEPITTLTTAWIDAYIAARGQEKAMPHTINGELSTLSLLVKKAIEWGDLGPSQQPRIHWLPTEQQPIRVLTPQEESCLLLAAPPRLRPLITFALHTGLRKGELMGLTWRDVDLLNRVVTVVSVRAKNRRLRRIPLTDTATAVLEMVRTLQGSHGPARVFGYRSISASFDRAAERAHLKSVSCHTLRHSFASRCIEAGVPLSVLQKWLGHHSLAMTEKYLHHTEAFEHESIRVLDGPPSSFEHARRS